MWTFRPILKTTLWGGDKIASFKGERFDATGIGESWEISGVEGSESVVAIGPDAGVSMSELTRIYGADLLGKKNYARFGHRFPLLVKFISTSANLSVQVHPGDELARRNGHPNGKTEMWFVIDSEDASQLALGLKRPLSCEEFRAVASSGEIEKNLNLLYVRKGDAFLIPPGTLHAIGSGILLAEIQQTSDLTYRVYDYGRCDSSGRQRELHLDLACEAVDLKAALPSPIAYRSTGESTAMLVNDSSFSVNLLSYTQGSQRDYSQLDSFVILTAVGGSAEIEDGNEKIQITQGMTLLLPATTDHIDIRPSAEFLCLESFIG